MNFIELMHDKINKHLRSHHASLPILKIGKAALLTLLLASCVNQPTTTDNGISQNSDSDKIFNLPYHMETLDNGLRVIIVKTDYPDLVSLHIPMQTGSRNEVEPGKSGFAHFFEHMMFKGTNNFSAKEYGDMQKNAGVDGNAYTSDDLTNYHISFPKEHLQDMLKLEADRFQNLVYPESVFRTEALAVKGEYLKNSSNPFRKMFEGIREAAFKKHTYRHTTMGFLRDIEDMPNQFDYSKTFFKRWYTPQLASVIVVGDVNLEQTRAWVKQYFGPWKRQENDVKIPTEPPQKEQIYKHIQFEKTPNTYITMAFKGPALDEEKKDKPALDLMAEAYFSSSSELYKDLVIDRQMVQFVGAYFPDRKDPQLLYIYTQLKDEKYAGEVKKAITDTIVKARTELLDEKRLNDIKNNLKYSFAQTLNSTGSIADTLATYVHFERDPEFLNRLYRTFDSVTAADIKKYASTYFIDNNLTMVTMSPKASMEKFDSTVSLDQPSQSQFANKQESKFKTLFKPTSSDLIDITWWLKAGSAQDPEGKKGLSALTSLMLTDGGSVSRSYNDIQSKMYPLAGELDASVDKEMIAIRGSVHKDNLDAWYALVKEQLMQPGWREEDFNRLKDQLVNNVENSLKSSNDEELGKEVLYEALYKQHPYGTLNAGHVDDIKKLTLEDLKNYYQQIFTQNNLTLAMAGNYPDSFKNKILADLNKLNVGEASKIDIEKAPKLKGRHATIVEKNTLSTAVSFGFPIDIKRGDEDWVALWLVRSWLGEHRNSNSYLYQRIRAARGMNYGDYAYIEYFPSGMFTTKPTVNVPRSQQIFQVWIRPLRTVNDAHFATRTAVWEMEKLIENGLTQEQFDSTKNFIKNYVPQLVDSQDRILGYAVDSEFYGTQNFVDYVRNGLDNLTLDKVNQVIKKYLQLDNVHFVFITKDAKDLKKRLAGESESPMKYNSEKPEEILQEDKIIAKYPLKLQSKNIQITPIESVFK